MLKALLSIAIVFSAASAMARDSFDGCGLGWEITSKKTVLATSTRATTNGFVPPTFGMTTGSLGCDQFDGIAATERSGAEYVAQNYETIRAELALGQGEYVEATAQSLGCDSSFGRHVQKNYKGLVAPTRNGVELYQVLRTEANRVCS